MITIDKDIKITIDKGDVPVFKDICEMARDYMVTRKVTWCNEERLQEIRDFLNIISEKAK